MEIPFLILGDFNFGPDKPVVVIWSDMQGTEFSTQESAEIEVQKQLTLENLSAMGARIFVLRDQKWEQVR